METTITHFPFPYDEHCHLSLIALLYLDGGVGQWNKSEGESEL